MSARVNAVFLVIGVLLAACSLFFWVSYAAYGTAYGAYVGLAGKEQALIVSGELALKALRRAALVEFLGVAIAGWCLLSMPGFFYMRGRGTRILTTAAIAVFLTFGTFALLRGL